MYFKSASLQSSLPRLVCVIATDEPLGLLESCSVAPLASWDAHFPSTPVSNQLILEIFLCLPYSPVCLPAAICRSSFISTAALSTSYAECLATDPTVALCLMVGLPLSHRPARGFTLGSLYWCELLVYSSTIMPVAAASLSVILPQGLDFPAHQCLTGV